MHIYLLRTHTTDTHNSSGSLWQYYRDEKALYNSDNIIDFAANDSNSTSFKFKP